jgi:hypothetical protein
MVISYGVVRKQTGENMKTIRITEKEFNAIQPHIVPAKTFDFKNNPDGVLMEIQSFDGTMNWLRSIIRKLPWSVGQDVVSILDKVFWFSNLEGK